jgi:proton-translocating NADH-quinone oxidoreductase chain L
MRLCFILGILMPVISLSAACVLNSYLTRRQLISLNLVFIFFSNFFFTSNFLNYLFNSSLFFEIELYQWIKFDLTILEFGFIYDFISVSMLFVVVFISSLVHLYSTEYMKNDPNLLKFLNYLTLFTLSMVILVSSNNFVQMFIGWEGVGVCSFLLINFWDTRIQANTSALKAIIINRIGDIGLLISYIYIYKIFGTFNYLEIFTLIEVYDFSKSPYILYISIFLFIGAVGKSAQIFLHVWLPDAMEGPTPVSALIHAATMVTAGVFLIIRCGFLFDLVLILKKIILIIGSITALFAGTTGLFQNDLKKIIAFSTCSQLGFMITSCGLGLYDLALFHLVMHAFFKALLFLSAGSIIHAFNTDEQDIRRMGGLLKVLPFTYLALFIGSLSLMGFPFTAGYYSKDLIIESLFIANCPITKLALILIILATFCTSFYSLRLIYYVFFKPTKASMNLLMYAHDSSLFMQIPLSILSLFSLFSGFFFKDMFIGLNRDLILGNDYSNFHQNLIFYNYYEIEELSIEFKLIPFIIFLVNVIVFYFFERFPFLFDYLLKFRFFRSIYKFLLKKWYFDILYNYLSNFILIKILKFLFFFNERGFLEIYGPLGLTILMKYFKRSINKFENFTLQGHIKQIIKIFIVFLVFYLFIIF